MKALITAAFSEKHLNRLRERCEVIYEPWRETNEIYFNAKTLLKKVEGVDIFITGYDELKEEFIEQCNLKIIASARQDPYTIKVKAASKKKIPVIYSPARNADSVADLSVLMMLSLLRKLTQVDRYIHSDKFEVIEFDDYVKVSNDFIGVELKGKKVGIIGFGNIGQNVGKRVQGFGAEIIVFDPFVPKSIVEKFGRQVEKIEDLVKDSDIITIHAAPVPETENIINSEMIALMKPTTILINTAKARMVDSKALYKALKEKKIGGAGLDVFDLEPLDEDNEFLEFDNTICLPHFGGNTTSTIEKQSKMLTDDVLAILDKKEPKNILNPEVLGFKKIDRSILSLGQEILDTCNACVREGLISGSSGNISMRIPDEEKIIITPSTLNYDEMTAEDMVILDFDGKMVAGKRNPSVEKDLHLGIYKERDDVGAVIHSHGPNSIALSLIRDELPPVLEEFVPYVGGPVKVAKYGEAGSKDLAKNIIEALGDRNAAIAVLHGNVCCGSHLKGAMTVLRMVENVAGIYLKAAPLGEPRQLDEEIVDYEMDMYEIFKESKKV